MTDDANRKARRHYQPEVEGLEALRMFSGLTGLDLPVAAEHGTITGADPEFVDYSGAWDAALDQSENVSVLNLDASVQINAASLQAGFTQLDRYLASSWKRAGLATHHHEDCSQAVYLSMLSTMGRPGFDYLIAAVGVAGIREVFNRDNTYGPTFFRAIDATKKRAQRERKYRSLDDENRDPQSTAFDGTIGDWAESLHEAIERVLTTREADLIRATLAGESLHEIGERWGVASKTVSNEKTRAYQKLRTFLSDPEDTRCQAFRAVAEIDSD